MAKAANSPLEAAYQERKDTALELVTAIHKLVKDFDKDGISWAHVGSMIHVVEEFRSIHQFLST
jgi:hypothetical protein